MRVGVCGSRTLSCLRGCDMVRFLAHAFGPKKTAVIFLSVRLPVCLPNGPLTNSPFAHQHPFALTNTLPLFLPPSLSLLPFPPPN